MSDPCSPVTVESADGARLDCCLHGGHILGWRPAGEQRDRLWLSPARRCGPGEAIRGGIPVIFPQFADRGPLPRHGIARDRAWSSSTATRDEDGAARWSAQLSSDAATRDIWAADFSLAIAAIATGAVLRVQLSVRNTGDAPLEFVAALHSYLSADPSSAIVGLGGRAAHDNADPSLRFQLPTQPLRAIDRRDISVGAVGEDEVRLLAGSSGSDADLLIGARGLDDRVVWNPGPGHGLADVPAGDEARFVCIETAMLRPHRLAAGELWVGEARFEALS